jgi:hypothetical protein
MAITFRANKGQALTYSEMDTNLGNYFYSSSLESAGTVLVLHYTSSIEVPVNNSSHRVPLLKGVLNGGPRRVAYFSSSEAITSSQGFIVDGTKVGINVDESISSLSYQLQVSGSVQCTSLFQTSDERLKTNVKSIDDALTKIVSSRGVSFDRDNGIKEVGVIAQEIENTVPEVVSKDENDYLSVNYSGLVGVLIEAVKEQQELIQTLFDRVQNLENNQ